MKTKEKKVRWVNPTWITKIFDYKKIVKDEKKGEAIGYVCATPVLVAWDGNMILWKFLERQDVADSVELITLCDRISAVFADDNYVAFNKLFGNVYMQEYFYKE